VIALGVSSAEAVTLQDLIDLKRAGLGDEVLLALIEVDGGVFSIDTASLTKLKQAGLSEKVIEAIVRSGRTRPNEEPPIVQVAPPIEPPAPQVVVIEHERPVVQQVAVPVYVPYLPVAAGRVRHRAPTVTVPFDPSPGFGAAPPLTYEDPYRPRQKPAEPVYWGWGGKLRPDAWKPAHEETPKQGAKAEAPNRTRGQASTTNRR
jgi:hypothetical protein